LPRAEIVACRYVQFTGQEHLTPAVFVMLPAAALARVEEKSVYTRFLFARAPHPTLLWAMVLGRSRAQQRERSYWLRTFFDLHQPEDRHMLARLCEAPPRLLFFEKESARLVQHFTIRIEFRQRDLIGAWLRLSAQLPYGSLVLAKQQLRAELDRIKPDILRDLTVIYGEAADECLE
jgi:hypothetical protein